MTLTGVIASPEGDAFDGAAGEEVVMGGFPLQDSLQAGQPGRLLGYPVVIAEDMPDVGADSLSVAFGNWRRGYTIVDRIGMRMLRDPYTDKGHVLFYGTKRAGGSVIDSDAIKILKFGVS